MASFAERLTGAMKADVRTFEEIESDQTAMPQAIAVIVIAGLAALIGNIWYLGVFGGLRMLVVSLCGYAVWTLFIVLIGTKLMPEPTTKADFHEGFRVIGFTAAPGILEVFAFIPILGGLISFVIWIWMMVVAVVAVRQVLDYTNTARAIIVCLLASLVYHIVRFMILIPLLFGSAIARGVTGY